jgi:hypothetical protein
MAEHLGQSHGTPQSKSRNTSVQVTELPVQLAGTPQTFTAHVGRTHRTPQTHWAHLSQTHGTCQSNAIKTLVQVVELLGQTHLTPKSNSWDYQSN